MQTQQLSKNETEFFESQATKVSSGNGIYYHLPKWYRLIDNDVYEVMDETELPENIKEFAANPLQKELDVTDKLLEYFQEVIKAIPECPLHGNLCIPHALEWIEEHKNTYSGEYE